MKRFHVHVSVGDLAQSIRFYSTLFGAEPAVTKPDYAKWMLDDPRVNFAISTGRAASGINHLGLQTDSDEELESLKDQLHQADLGMIAEKNVACCYARSNKYWVKDPAGVVWETFHSLLSVPTYDEADPGAAHGAVAAGLCGTAGACGTVAAADTGGSTGNKAAACCG